MGKFGLAALIGVTAVVVILVAYGPPILSRFDFLNISTVLVLAAAWIAVWSGLLVLVWTPRRS